VKSSDFFCPQLAMRANKNYRVGKARECGRQYGAQIATLHFPSCVQTAAKFPSGLATFRFLD
jgi:hypothetical protein